MKNAISQISYLFNTIVMTRFSTSNLHTNLHPISSIKSKNIQLNSTQVAHNVIQYFSFEYAQNQKNKNKISSNYESSLV